MEHKRSLCSDCLLAVCIGANFPSVMCKAKRNMLVCNTKCNTATSKLIMYYFIDTYMRQQPEMCANLLQTFDEPHLVAFLELGGYEQLVERGLHTALKSRTWMLLMAKLHAVCAVNVFRHEWHLLRRQEVRCEVELQRVISRVALFALNSFEDSDFDDVSVLFGEKEFVVDGRRSLQSVLDLNTTDYSYKIDGIQHYLYISLPLFTVSTWIKSRRIIVEEVKIGTETAIWFLPSTLKNGQLWEILLDLVWKHQEKPFKRINCQLSRLMLSLSERQLMDGNLLQSPLVRLLASHPELCSVKARLRYLRLFASSGPVDVVCGGEREMFALGRQMAASICLGTERRIEFNILERMIKWEPIISAEKQSFIDGFNTILPFQMATIFLNTQQAWNQATITP